MADSILRLKVESQEYDQKIKRAAEGLRRYVEVAHQQGDVIGRLLGDTRKYVDSIGQMDTVNKTARGSLSELKSAFTEFRHVYNQLSDEEKKGDFGKQLNSQLDQLKIRIKEGENELKSISNELNGGGGLKDALDQVAGKFGLNIDMVTKFGGVIGVTTTALKVAKDAFFQSESNIDEWGRTVKGAEGAYDIFLQTLNNGNWSNFFSNLSQAITGARDLYDAFDRLNSIKANNAVAIAMTKAEIQNLRLLKQQGQDVDDKIKAATQRLSALQSQSSNAGINAGRSQVANTLRNGVNSIGGAYINDATLNRVADNISKQGQAYFDYMKRRAAALEKQGMVTKTQTINDSQGGTYERQYKVFDINALSAEQQKQYAIAKVVTERETEIQKGLTVWSQAVNEQASNTREIFRDNRYAGLGSGGGRGGSGSTFDISKIAFNPKEVLKGADDANFVSPYLMMLDEIKEKILDVKDADLGSALKVPDMYKKQLDEYAKGVTAIKASINTTASLIGTIGQAFNAIENPAAKVAAVVAQAIANIALAYSSALAKDVTQKFNIYGFIAAAAASTISMASTIASIHSSTGYANGGEIKGNSYSGDNIPIMANAGEIILNRAQQANVASGLQGNGLRGLSLKTKVKGTELLVWLDNSLAQSGRGELVTWGQ